MAYFYLQWLIFYIFVFMKTKLYKKYVLEINRRIWISHFKAKQFIVEIRNSFKDELSFFQSELRKGVEYYF